MDYLQCILKINPNWQGVVLSNGGKIVVVPHKLYKGETPSLEDVQAVWEKVKIEKKAMAYIELRRADYPPIAEYIDGIVKRDDVQVQAYLDACRAVKRKYPKPV